MLRKNQLLLKYDITRIDSLELPISAADIVDIYQSYSPRSEIGAISVKPIWYLQSQLELDNKI